MNNTINFDASPKGDPVDNISFDDKDDPTIDLTEIIEYDKQTKVTKVVSGVESYLTTGQLDPKVALILGVKAANNTMDPSGGLYNNRFGGEGFFTTALKALEDGILYIIRFIKKIVIWVIDKIKMFFGLQPSTRQAEVIATKLPELKQELIKYFSALGWPGSALSLEKWLEDMPSDKRRNAQMSFVASKLVAREEYVNSLADIFPAVQQIMKMIGNGARRAREAKKHFNRALEAIVSKSKHASYELNNEGRELLERMAQVIQSLNYQELIPSLSKLSLLITGKNLPDGDEMTQISIDFAEAITACTELAKVSADSVFVTKIEQILGKMSVESLEHMDTRESVANLQILWDIASADDLQKITTLGKLTGETTYLVTYQQMMRAVNVYTNFAKASMEGLRLASNTLNDFSDWYAKATKFMVAMVANDIDTVGKLVAQAQAKHMREGKQLPFEVDANNLPKNLTSMSDADAQTVFERMAHMNKEVLNENLFGVRDSINNFSKAAGLGKLA